MRFYVFIFNALDLMITGPFAQEEEAMAASDKVSLPHCHITRNSTKIEASPDFTPWDSYAERYPEFVFK